MNYTKHANAIYVSQTDPHRLHWHVFFITLLFFYSYVFADRKLAFCLVSLIKNLLACVSRF